MKDEKQFLPVTELIEKIEALKQKNRDLLTVEEHEVLNECISRLDDIGDDRNANAVIWIRVCMTLLKWFTETDMFGNL